MGKVYVLGGAQTDFERNWSKEGKNETALLREIMQDTCKTVGLSMEDIGQLNRENRVACFVGNFIAEKYCNQGHLGALLTNVDPAFYGVPSARYEAACASSSVALDAAISKIQCGMYDVAIVVGWELMKTVSPQVGGDYLGCAAYYEEEARNKAFPFPQLFGKLADEIVEKYHLDEEHFARMLAEISAINYENAKRNPQAQTRNWFMSREQANNRGSDTNPIISGRLAVSDCSQVTDGAACVVLISERFAQEKGISPTVYVMGEGHRVAPMRFSEKMEEAKNSEYILPWTRQTVLDAYARAGVTAEDVDFFETHDCFTSSEYAAISAFGITKPGLEYEAIENRVIAFEGAKPINPSGGLIGCGHPVGATGVRMFLDLYRQLAGEAGAYQLKNPKVGAMLNLGGSATTNFVFILGKQKENAGFGKAEV